PSVGESDEATGALPAWPGTFLRCQGHTSSLPTPANPCPAASSSPLLSLSLSLSHTHSHTHFHSPLSFLPVMRCPWSSPLCSSPLCSSPLCSSPLSSL